MDAAQFRLHMGAVVLAGLLQREGPSDSYPVQYAQITKAQIYADWLLTSSGYPIVQYANDDSPQPPLDGPVTQRAT